MLHISKTKSGKFIVALVSDKNGKVISTSEPLNSKQGAKKNVEALLSSFCDICSDYCQDNTGKSIVVFRVNLRVIFKNEWIVSNRLPSKPYIPGKSVKNSKRKPKMNN